MFWRKVPCLVKYQKVFIFHYPNTSACLCICVWSCTLIYNRPKDLLNEALIVRSVFKFVSVDTKSFSFKWTMRELNSADLLGFARSSLRSDSSKTYPWSRDATCYARTVTKRLKNSINKVNGGTWFLYRGVVKHEIWLRIFQKRI